MKIAIPDEKCESRKCQLNEEKDVGQRRLVDGTREFQCQIDDRQIVDRQPPANKRSLF